MKQEMMGWHCHQLYHVQIICTSLQTDNHASTSWCPTDQQCQKRAQSRRERRSPADLMLFDPPSPEERDFVV